MKSMNSKRIFLGLFLFAFVFSSCGPQLFDYPWEAKDEENGGGGGAGGGVATLEVVEKQLISAMPLLIEYGEHAYQYMRGNSVDVFAGYFTPSNSEFLFGGSLPCTYSTEAFLNYYGGPGSKSLYPQINDAYTSSENLGYPEWKAIAQILYAYSSHEVADIYGAMPYDDYRNLKENPPIKYFTVKDIYYRIFEELTAAVQVLKDQQQKGRLTATDLQRIEGSRIAISRGDWKRWVKFANSIRLRLAMNMVKADPAKAQMEAEAAVNDDIGVLQSGDLDIGLTSRDDQLEDHPLYFISEVWNDIRLGASLENILKRMNNPLLEKWFTINKYPILDEGGNNTGYGAFSGYFGIRQGCFMIPRADDKTKGYSMYACLAIPKFPKDWLKVTEVLFLKAEGALRGWGMGGTAQSLYEQGIRRVFEENGLADKCDAYLAQTAVQSIDYVDPYNQTNNIEGRVEVGVKWDESDSQELKLEKIITQKYIAIFPMSAEAWTTFRRTGYPRLFPIPEDNNLWTDEYGLQDIELQIRRIPYRITEENEAEMLESAIPTLLEEGTVNNAGGRLWWDVQTEERDFEGRVIPRNF